MRHTTMRIITTVPTVAAAVALLAGCGGHSDPAAAPSATGVPSTAAAAKAEPRTEAAVRKAAKEEFDSYAAGDYGATWDLFYAPAKKAISRAEYERLLRLCPDFASGMRFEIEKITMDSDHSARVRVSRSIAIMTYRFVYEAGHWRFVPGPESMRDYRTKTVAQMAHAKRAQGSCGKA